MTGFDVWGAAMLAAAMAAQPAADQPGAFPCGSLGNEGYKIFEGIGAPAEPPTAAPVRLKKNALLAVERYPLETRWLTFDDAALASDGGKLPPIPFRAFRIDGSRAYCTSTWREAVFGPRNQDGNYLLRCLVDEDGDARFESFRAHGELVSYNMRSGKTGKPTGAVPPTRRLPKAVALVESAAVRDPNAAFAPRLVTELRVVKLTAQDVTLGLETQVAMLPGRSGERFRGAGDVQTMTVPLREGTWTSPAGTSIVLTRNGRDWFAAVAGRSGPPARLQCGGSVVDTGTMFTIMSEGGMSVVSRRNLPPS